MTDSRDFFIVQPLSRREISLKRRKPSRQRMAYANLLANFHRSLGKRPTPDDFEHMIQQMPTVQHRDGKQIEDPRLMLTRASAGK